MVWQTLANLSAGNQPVSILDVMFANVAQWGAVDDSASGTNVITLTPTLSGYSAPAYANYVTYRFVAANNSSGPVTLKVGALAALNVYGADGATQMDSGNVIAGRAYLVTYNSVLNTSAGGWYLTPVGSATGGVSNPVTLGEGGSGQVTAPAARGSSGFNIDQATPVSFNGTITITATDRTIISSTTAMTGGHTATLPAANAVNPGQLVEVLDLSGVTGTQTLTIQRAGADTINGGTSVALATQYSGWRFKSDGISKWTAQYLPAALVSAAPIAGNGITVSGSTVSINTNNANGIGQCNYCISQSGTIAAGSTGSVANVNIDTGTGLLGNSTNLPGTWRNVSGGAITVAIAGMCIRVS